MFTWSYKSTTATALIVIVGVIFAYQATDSHGNTNSGRSAVSSTTTATTATTTLPTVETVRPNADADAITVSGEVRGQLSATISSQISGVINQVPATIGQSVERSDTLAVFANQSERASVRQAEANLKSQEANLSELQSGSRQEELRNAELAVETARANLQDARRQLFDTDLQAYLETGDQAVRSGSLQAPSVSGTYKGNTRGEYRVELYRSAAKSGYSFRYSGLESGMGTVSTETPMPLGDKGLYIQFPENFAANQLLEWVVPIPNTRSQQLSGAQNRFRQAEIRLEEAQNELALTQKGTRRERIDAAQAQVESAQANLQQAQAQLNKTRVEAPFSGTVLSVAVDPGEFVSAGQTIAKLVNRSRIEISSSLTPQAARQLSVGDAVQIGESDTGRITAVAPAVDPDTGNVEVRVAAEQTDNTSLIPGTYVDLAFSTDQDQQPTDQSLPLSAVGTTADDSYVLVVDDNDKLRRMDLDTGAVNGSTVAVRSPLPNQPIVKDISGLSVGQKVRVTNSIRNE